MGERWCPTLTDDGLWHLMEMVKGKQHYLLQKSWRKSSKAILPSRCRHARRKSKTGKGYEGGR